MGPFSSANAVSWLSEVFFLTFLAQDSGMTDETKKEGLGRRQRFGIVFGVGHVQKVRVPDRDAEKVFSGLSKVPWNFFATWDQSTRIWKWLDVSNGTFIFRWGPIIQIVIVRDPNC